MSSEYVDDAEDIATRAMYELLGRRWVYPFITTTERIATAPGQTALVMQGRPIVSVQSVVRSGDTALLPFTIESKHRIRLATPLVPHSAGMAALQYRTIGGACNPPSAVSVTYTYGARPPADVLYAIESLAKEITLAMNEDDTCRLPPSVTTVSRQGMSMTVLDSQEFLDKGRTGIEEVDAMLARYNSGGAKRPARVFGRVSAPPTRTNTTQN